MRRGDDNEPLVDWVSVADIPRDMADVRIPRLRINEESLAPIHPPLTDVRLVDALDAVVKLVRGNYL